ncbi:MAG: FAD-dependent oxidoreductase [Acidimicrobiaceae bacterium]|jgi:pyruvate/2-oxoglutarate dehydrogenase complex dihydrolipoamide dehydrogenase (E3) component|nr:FAD-dependent oxidoreductase [Acidimicrobiaceae bacterium]
MSMGAEVTLVVSRQQVLLQKDAEIAAALEEDFLRRGVRLLKGARATSIERVGDDVVVSCDDGRVATGSHALLAIGSIPTTGQLGLERPVARLTAFMCPSMISFEATWPTSMRPVISLAVSRFHR